MPVARREAGIIALTKSDLVDSDTLSLAKMDVQDYVRGSFLEQAPLVAVSSKIGTGLTELKTLWFEKPAYSAGRIRLEFFDCRLTVPFLLKVLAPS